MTPRFFLFFLLLLGAHAGELYSTDFDDFPLGDNQWTDNDGWIATDKVNGVNFIDDNAFNNSLGKTAGLGLERPNSSRVTVFKVLNHDHVSTEENIIEIETLLAIKDSDNNFRDDFYFSIFNNSGGNPIASIRFDNQDPNANNTRFGIWREDGVSQFDTQVNFIHEELYDLYLCIDLDANTWSADLSGIPLFTDENFTSSASGAGINLGIVAYEWQLTSTSTFFHGDNFLLVGDLRVTSISSTATPAEDFVVSKNSSHQAVLNWHGKAGLDYQVEYSTDLENWQDDLPNSLVSPGLSSGAVTFTDPTYPMLQQRFYRIVTKAP